ncbi:MAG: thiamine phosphate synthase [Actinobacteria bacterium]|nr:MAG: thiamine phosphate synthase [Actinomycetota bacterium]
MASPRSGAERRARLKDAQLYLVCPPSAEPADRGGRELSELVRAAIAGGVDVVQLREKHLADDALTERGRELAALCRQSGALFILNDRPDLAVAAGADGAHVGQDDMPVADARALVGAEMLIGLSTHSEAQIDAACENAHAGSGADYIAVGPVHETPTKPGRPAVGVGLVGYAAARARELPFFAIGGLDSDNLGAVTAAGARRVVVLRAIADAADPERAARELRSQLGTAEER